MARRLCRALGAGDGIQVAEIGMDGERLVGIQFAKTDKAVQRIKGFNGTRIAAPPARENEAGGHGSSRVFRVAVDIDGLTGDKISPRSADRVVQMRARGRK